MTSGSSATAGTAPEAPKLVAFGKYLLLDRIAQGGMAEVWLGKTVEDDRVSDLLAIKRLLTRFSDDEEFLHMFVDEARIAGQLDHPGIVQIHELGKVGSSLYIAMEFVWGRDLLGILRRLRELGRAMDPETVAYLGARMCEALHFAHTAKGKDGKPLHVVHRDVSPQNVIVSFDGKVKLIDFGIAKASARSTKTQAGTLKGKVGYMSPEQVRGAEVDARSDQFAVGTCLYEMLTGLPLFSRPNNFEAMELVREAEVPPLAEVAPHTPPALVDVVMKALAKRAGDRFESAYEMQKALTHFLADVAPGYERVTLTTWLRAIFADEMAEEKARLDALDLIGRPAALPDKRKRFNSSTRLEIGAHDLFDDDEDAETRIFEGAPLSKLEIEVRPVGPYEVFFQRDDERASAPDEAARPGSGSQVRPLQPYRPARAPASEGYRAPRADLAELGPYRKPREGARDTEPSGGTGPATLPERVPLEPSVLVSAELGQDALASGEGETRRTDADRERAFDPQHLVLDPAEINSQVIRALLPTGKTDPAAKNADASRREPTGSSRTDGRRDPTTRRRHALLEAGQPRRRRSDAVFFAIAALFMLVVGAGATYWWLAGSATSSIEVHTTPATHGTVLIDGVSRGRVPLRVDGLSPGRHTVTIVADGYEPMVREVTLAPRASALLELPMLPEHHEETTPARPAEP